MRLSNVKRNETPGRAAHDTWCAEDDWDELDGDERDLWEATAEAAIAVHQREQS